MTMSWPRIFNENKRSESLTLNQDIRLFNTTILVKEFTLIFYHCNRASELLRLLRNVSIPDIIISPERFLCPLQPVFHSTSYFFTYKPTEYSSWYRHKNPQKILANRNKQYIKWIVHYDQVVTRIIHINVIKVDLTFKSEVLLYTCISLIKGEKSQVNLKHYRKSTSQKLTPTHEKTSQQSKKNTRHFPQPAREHL